ncbi:MAG: hypothetical protein KF803_11115 [Cyclobacteriaceae bacterium]|nr:hypothetical protein [Cyclobacteriaceae bacterium]
MRNRILLFLLFPIGLINAQGRLNSQPGYNPIYPKLISMMHSYDASTQLGKKNKFTLEQFNSKENYQQIEIYFCYELDSTLEKMGETIYFHPPKQLMDFYVIHHYNYRLNLNSAPFFSDDEIKIPEITVPTHTFIKDIQAQYYYLKNGKLRLQKIKKNEILPKISQEKLVIRINTIKPAVSYIEIDIKLKSRNFEDINPMIVQDIENIDCSIRIPKIFEYEITSSENVVIEDEKFKMLKFYRNTTNWDKMIEAFDIGLKSYSWNVSKGTFLTPKLKLKKIMYPIGSDIGFPIEYLVQSE